jgi:hypothetical protein
MYPSGPNVNKVVQGDLTLYVEEYVTPEKSEAAFDTEMAEEGVLPLLILVENNGQQTLEVKTADILVRGDDVLKPLTPEEAADKASRSAVGKAIGWSMIVPIIAIPIAVIASASHTSKVNLKMVADFNVKAFQDGAILPNKDRSGFPNKDRSGFLFLELEEDMQDTSGLTLEMTAKNIETGEVMTMTAAVPAATFTQKEKASSQDEKGKHPSEIPFSRSSWDREKSGFESDSPKKEASSQDQDVEGSLPEGEEGTTVTQEGLTLARGTKQTMPKSGTWLLGEWVGTRKGTWGDWETTIRITSYDQASHAFKGDGYLVVPNADKWSSVSPIIDLVISAVIDDEGKVVMTIHRDGGKSSSFNLKRKGDAGLYGTTAYGPPSLSLRKKP